MQVIVRSIQLICLSYLTCDSLLSNEKENRRMLLVSACCALCSEQNSHLSLESCYQICDKGITDENPKKLRKIHENHYIKLLCRDDTTLAFQILLKEFGSIKIKSENQTALNQTTSNFNNDNNSNNNMMDMDKNSTKKIINENNLISKKSINGIYFIRIYKAENVTDQVNILTNSSYVKVENLEPNTTYNITATVVYSNREYSLIVQNQQFTTLHRKYTPSKVQKIELGPFIQDEHDKYTLKAIILWKPSLEIDAHFDRKKLTTKGKYNDALADYDEYSKLYLENSPTRQFKSAFFSRNIFLTKLNLLNNFVRLQYLNFALNFLYLFIFILCLFNCIFYYVLLFLNKH